MGTDEEAPPVLGVTAVVGAVDGSGEAISSSPVDK